MSNTRGKRTLLDLAAQIVSAHVSNNSVPANSLSPLLASIIKALTEAGIEAEAAKRDPAVPINKSIFPDHIICLECGGSFSVLKRHVRSEHSLTPEAYRIKWGLSFSYPLVASDYARRRSVLAKQHGLGRKPIKRDATLQNLARAKRRRLQKVA